MNHLHWIGPAFCLALVGFDARVGIGQGYIKIELSVRVWKHTKDMCI